MAVKELFRFYLSRLKAALSTLDAGRLYTNRDAFVKDLKRAIAASGVSLPTAQLKAVWQTLSEPDETAEVCRDGRGKPEADPSLRDTENVPLKEDIKTYFRREVLPHVPDAWVDEDKTKVGYEIPFNRHFYKYTAPRPLEEIDADLQRVSGEIMEMLKGVIA